jgi:exo-beta-1,3-glucanase (GH17 family)
MSYSFNIKPEYKRTDSIGHDNPTDGVQDADLKALFDNIMKEGVHGFCFSLYEDGQKPGDIISEDQIRRRLAILKPHSRWVRSFSCIEGNEIIPRVAKEMGIKTLVGAWIGTDAEKNEQELVNLIQLCKDGYVDVAAVGNEVLYRGEMDEATLIATIKRVKAEVGDIPVGYVDAYYEFVERPELTEACDLVLCNCYPYWEGTPFEKAFGHMQHMHRLAKAAGRGKPVLITETGWPSQGENKDAAVPSKVNALRYFLNTQIWSKEENVGIFYFSSFDESWKVGAEGEVGAYWGIWDKHERLKY